MTAIRLEGLRHLREGGIPKMEGHYNSQRNLRCQVLMVCMPVMGGYSASRRLSGLRVSSLGHQVSLINALPLG